MTFFEELKRRRVFRVAAMYAVGAWAVIQVVTTVFPQLGLPDWSVRATTILAISGFPVALILAWLYDVKRRIVPAIILGGLVAAGFYIRTIPKGSVDDNSVIVLPFADESDKHDQAYLSDGITEEILNSLARVNGLRVPGRTTSFSFKGKDVPASQIAQQLKVGNVLEGSVQKEGDRVHITASLVDAKQDKQLWSDTYDRQLSDVFAVQREIAKAIVDKLRLQLTQPQTDETKSADAHELYLKGLYYWNRRYASELPMALDAFRAATEADPKYARAWAGMAMTYAVLPQYMHYDHKQASGEGRAAARRALELDPNSAEAHAALSQIASELDWQWAEARHEAEEAVRLNPKYATAHQWLSEVLEAYGDCKGAMAEADRAQLLDPLSSVVENEQIFDRGQCGRLDEAVAQARALIARDPQFQSPYALVYAIDIMQKNYDDALKYATDDGRRQFAVHLKKGERAQAVAEVNAAVKAGSPPLDVTAGWALLDMPDSALKYYNLAIDAWAPSVALTAYRPDIVRYKDHPLYKQAVAKLHLPYLHLHQTFTATSE